MTVPKNLHMQICGVWMVAWLEHAECQLQAVDQVFFAVIMTCPGIFEKKKSISTKSSVMINQPKVF